MRVQSRGKIVNGCKKMIACCLVLVLLANRCFSCSSRHAGKSKIPSVSFGQTTHFCPNCRFACRYDTLLPLYVDVDYVIDRVNGKEESHSPKDKASNMFHTLLANRCFSGKVRSRITLVTGTIPYLGTIPTSRPAYIPRQNNVLYLLARPPIFVQTAGMQRTVSSS